MQLSSISICVCSFPNAAAVSAPRRRLNSMAAEREREREREENEWQKVRYGEKDMKSTRGGRETGLVAGDALISFLMEGSVRGLGG